MIIKWAFIYTPFHSICPKTGFFHPFKSKNEARHSRTLQVALRSPFLLPTRRISDFLASSRGPNLVRCSNVPLLSHRGSKMESTHEVMWHVIHGSSKVLYHRSLIPLFLLTTLRISYFLASWRGPNLVRCSNVLLPSHRGPKMKSAHEVMWHVIHGGSKVLYHRSSIPPFLLPTRRISYFLASSRGSKLIRCFDVHVPSHRGPKLETVNEVLDFEFVGIPALLFRRANFHRFLKLMIAFFPSRVPKISLWKRCEWLALDGFNGCLQ
ncbi:hypothetical protein AVEN_267287-1 [Araneus ventricosus]|uniref:Uncharacterized protein n=1 Tax=Araneus ventricosus TaxID=182803 RepID=A0A4Y2MP62_ARAVE|nr:hypothetical protein AVEN_267287-1 [Araneus ventricosus]